MKLKGLKSGFALMLCAFIILGSVFVCSAEDKRYEIPEIDDMVIMLPDNMLAATRSSKETELYFTSFGLNYNKTMHNFQLGNIYLQGMDYSSATTVTVTMTKTNESEDIGNYTALQDSEMTEIKNSFLNNGEYISCTPDSVGAVKWLCFDLNVKNGANTIKAYQANTVYDGMNINITFQRNAGNVTAQDYNTFNQIVSSVKFLKFGSANNMTPYIIAAFVLIAIILIIMAVVLVKKSKEKSRRNKNNRIIEELADKYNLKKEKTQKKHYGYKHEETNDTPINVEKKTEKSSEDNNYISRHARNEEDLPTTENESEDIIKDISDLEEKPMVLITDDFEDELDDTPLVFSDGNNNNIPPEPDESEYDEHSAEGFVFTEDSEEDDDYDNDEELIRQAAKRTKFYDSDDFFEEAPKKSMGVISSQEIEDAEDYDVITEVEKRATEVETVKHKNSGKDVVINVFKSIGGSIKSFGIHCGYFCTNLSRMIKRKHAAKKRRKAEEERRERARLRAERESQNRRENGGLVRVHSRDDRRPPQNRRPSRNSRPQTRRPDNSQRRR